MRPKVREYLENALCLAVLLTLAVAVLWPAVIQGKVPSAAGGVIAYPPWEEARGNGTMLPDSADASLQMHRFYPWYAYLAGKACLTDLLWSPAEGGGLPFLGLWRTRCLSPFSLPFYLFPLGTALTLSLLLKFLVAGYGAYHVARRFGFQPPLALLCGVTFEFSGYLTLWSGWPVSDVLPWLPLALMFTERLAIGQTQYWAHAALQIGLMALGGDPETLTAVLVFLLLYLMVRVVFNLRNPRLAIVVGIAFTGSMCTGMALAGLQIAPFWEFMTQSTGTGRAETSALLTPRSLLAAFLPDYFGHSGAVWTADGVARPVQVLKLLYVGVVSLWMLPLWLSVRRFVPSVQKQRIESMLFTSFLVTAVAVCISRIDAHIPLSRYLSAEHLLFGNALVLALMAGAAAEEWLALNAEECGAAIIRLFVYVPMMLIGGIALLWAQPASSPSPVWLQLLIQGALAAGVFAVLGITLLKPSARTLGYGLTALAITSLFLANHSGLRFSDPATLFPKTKFIEKLQAEGERLSGSEAIKRWPLAGSLVPQIYAPAGIQLQRGAAFLQRAEAEPFLMRRAGTPYLLLTAKDIQGTFAAIRPMLEIKHVFPSGAVLFKDLGAKPRAWVSYEGRAIESFDPAALSATLPPLMEGVAPPAGPATPEGQVTLVATNTTTEVKLNVHSTRPGVLVLADAYYPGWEATVNGESAQIFPVDGMFRGVQIKENTTEVIFRYNPVSFKIGLGVTLAAMAVLLTKWAVMAFHMLRRRLHRA